MRPVRHWLWLLFFVVSLRAQNTTDFENNVRAAMGGSLEKQKMSVQRQVSTAGDQTSAPGFYSVTWPASPQFQAAITHTPDCDPMPKAELDKLVDSATQKEGVSADLVRLVIGKESAAKPCAISPKGAQGLMQLMPETAWELGVRDAFDPQQNVDGGVRLLKRLLAKYGGDVPLALGAYNAGSGRVDQAGGVPKIPETLNYVSDIMSRLRPE
ncbi:MAG: lytic transglycosylase domain-containing protein [Acidobacteriaceae bacterium]|nr:lytic transglycosylase domain-containing protein [Acidobacteriaceae bacterium]